MIKLIGPASKHIQIKVTKGMKKQKACFPKVGYEETGEVYVTFFLFLSIFFKASVYVSVCVCVHVITMLRHCRKTV